MLEYAYAGNILVVTPVIYLLWFAEDGAEKVFGARMQLSSAMQTLVASMWTAIVLVSIAGLKWERELVGLLVFQCVYKLIFICVYVVPRARARDWDAIPVRLVAIFALGLIAFPLLIFEQFWMR